MIGTNKIQIEESNLTFSCIINHGPYAASRGQSSLRGVAVNPTFFQYMKKSARSLQQLRTTEVS
jgi:hypothetical protein